MDDRTAFPMTETVRWGWDTLWANLGFFAGFMLIIFGVQVVVQVIPSYALNDNTMAEFLTSVVGWLVGAVLEMGVIVVTLKFYDGEHPQLSDLFNQINLVFVYIGASIIYTVMVCIGLVFLIAPGIYLAVRFHFFGFLIIEEGCGPIEALSRSAEVTKGQVGNLLLWWLMILGLNVLGLLALVVGILITAPVTMLATAVVYRHLNPGQRDGLDFDEPAPADATA